MVTWRYISDSLKGTERKQNKDRVWVKEDESSIFAVLFDGISSADDANKGIDIAISFLEENYPRVASKGNFHLSELMYEVNNEILKSNLESPFTTYSAIYLEKKSMSAQISNMGDSRTYEITSQYLKQLSQDDNLLHNKNVVTKYLGMLNLDREHVTEDRINVGEGRFLLCSDGFYSMMEGNLARFYEILNFKTGANIKKSLRSEVKGKNFDDSSYIMIFN